ncbi:MAG: phage major capsid protein [Clostridia bacterium]|jgi:HK97 family phage major capsid protein|nr:MAG: phage major capsid protein [Clostridia bacterium]
MALRQLLKRSQLAAAQAESNKHKEQRAALDERRSSLQKREADAAAALEELTAESTPEERAAVEAEVAAIEAETAALNSDEQAYEAEQARLDGIVADIEKEIKELDERSATPQKKPNEKPVERKDDKIMETRTKFFGMTNEQRGAFFARDDVKGFIGAIRTACQSRAISGGKLTIPETMLEIIRDNLGEYSKLSKFVTVRRVNGTTRQNIMGTMPEGIWMEATGALNELDLSLNQVTVDGYMVGGFIPVHNTLLDDSDLNLGAEIMRALAYAIGSGVDWAILFGTGSNMPIGIATRLAQTTKPSGWSDNAPEWKDLHTSNIKKLNIATSTGAAFFASLIEALGIAIPKYSNGRAFWVMNRKTHIKLMTKALEFNAAAALVAGMNNTMPVIGGEIVEFEDDKIADNEIIGGYGSVYLLAERGGAEITSSEHVRFLENQTLYKGYARYDGIPVFGEAFVMVNFANTDVTTTRTFPVDYANAEIGTLGVTAAAGTASGDTVLTVTGAEASGTTLKYVIGDRTVKNGDKVTGYTALTSGTTQITATAGKTITVVELDGNARAIKVGKAAAVPRA